MPERTRVQKPEPAHDYDYYEILDVRPGADAEAIQAAYRAACKKYHPDTGLPSASAEQMVLINRAYAVLSDARLRADYDRSYGSARVDANLRTARLRPGDRQIRLAAGLTLSLARVPAGEFLLGGCPAGPLAHGAAADAVVGAYRFYLDEYYIGLYPVTVAQYRAFAQATGRRATPWARREESFDPGELADPETITRLDRNWRHPFGERSNLEGKADHPVMIVTWHDAVAFCQWASAQSGAHVRLPSAAEWHKAARGVDGRCYPWGRGPAANPRLCNCLPDARPGTRPPAGDTTPVGAFSPHGDSPYGCSDVLGNVWEWTSTRTRDRENSYRFGHPYRADDGREEPGGRDLRLLLGGSFLSAGGMLTLGGERELEPLRARDTGFRVCVMP